MPTPILRQVEAYWGESFSGVRVQESALASALGADAFTVGESIVFAPGRFRPFDAGGAELLGHELTHVVQQRHGRVAVPGTGVFVVEDDALEREAHEHGRLFAAALQPSSSAAALSVQASERQQAAPRPAALPQDRAVQRRVTLNGQGYGVQDSNLHVLRGLVLQDPARSRLAGRIEQHGVTIDQLLTRLDFRNRSFASIPALEAAILEDALDIFTEVQRYPEPNWSINAVPKLIHHFWSGRAMGRSAFRNLLQWQRAAVTHGWTQYIMTDASINARIGDADLALQFDALRLGGAVILDMGAMPLNAGFPTSDNCLALGYRKLAALILDGNRSKFPYLSDLARYCQLYTLGGVYVDVDVGPGTVDLSRPLTMRDPAGLVPFVGPCFRTRRDAEQAGYLSAAPGDRAAALLAQFVGNCSIGNHFICTRKANPLIQGVASIAAEHVLAHDITNGGIDVLKALGKVISSKHVEQSVVDAIPPWLALVEWVTEESDHTVD